MSKASKSNIEWQVYGELDYGASHDLPAGLEEWSLLRDHLKQYGLDRMTTCMELGCGAGRLTNALAQDFDIVHALDVSDERITQAHTIPNSSKVSFHLVVGPSIPLPDAVCDLCISTHVLQHISDMQVIEAYLREMYRVLRPDGYILLHVPVIGAHGMTGSLAEVIRRRGKEFLKEGVLALTRKLMHMGFHHLPWKIDRYEVFSFVQLDSFLRRLGFVGVELRILPWAEGHAYVFGKAQRAQNSYKENVGRKHTQYGST
jgi:SAM-dependent methyltransferase